MAALGNQQAQTLASNLPLPPTDLSGNKPKVIFPSPLVLTAEQEQNVLHHAKARLDTLSDELGRDVFDCPNYEPAWTGKSLSGALNSFMGRQYFAHLIYHGHVAWRANNPDTIYSESNLHLPLSRRILTQQIARAISFVTGTEPWWTAYDVGNEDLDFAKKLERWLRHELHNEGDLTSDINTTIELTMLQGQQIVKCYHENDIDYYETVANVAVGEKQAPIIALDGDYIFEDDEFIADPAWQVAPALPIEGDPLAVAEPIQPAGDAPMVLKRDLRTPQPPVGPDGKMVFKATKIMRTLEKFNGPKAGNVFYLDFLCPLDAESIDAADCCIHLYDRTIIQLAHKYLQSGFGDITAEKQLEMIADLVAKLTPVSNTGDVSGANGPRGELGESVNSLGKDTQEPSTKLAEVWLTYDVNGDGIQENIMLIMDRGGEVPIYYDYAANVTSDGRRPFKAPLINRVAGRWYGQGQMAVFANLQEAADLMLNRWNFSQSSSARIDFTHPERTVQGKNDPNFKLNWGEMYTPDGSYTAKDIIESVYLTDIKSDKLQQILEFIMQIAMNMSGVTNVNDGNMSGMDTAKLATGVRNLERSGQELFGKFLADITPGIRQIVMTCMEISLANLNKPKVFRFFEGNAGRMGTITKEEVRNVKLDVRIELTKYRSEQDEVQARMATELAKEYYQLPPLLQVRLLSLYRQRLQALQIRNVDELIQPLSQEEMQIMRPPMPGNQGVSVPLATATQPSF